MNERLQGAVEVAAWILPKLREIRNKGASPNQLRRLERHIRTLIQESLEYEAKDLAQRLSVS